MSAIQLKLISHQTEDEQAYQHLQIQITSDDGVISPADLKQLSLPTGIQFSQGIVIEGRAPIWLYAYLVHKCHPALWVGCYDPRLVGAVVVQTHTHAIAVGEVIKLSLPQ